MDSGIKLRNTEQTNKVSKIDIWAILYLIIVYVFTNLFNNETIIVYIIYFVLALPFIYCLDKFAMICFILSTMSYYFVGADEAIFSIYSILGVLTLFKFFINKKIKRKNIIPIILLILAIIVSFLNSEFSYTTGMYAMIYNMIIMIIVMTLIDIKEETITNFLPMLAIIQLIYFIVILIANGYYDGFGYTVSSEVNHNTFGTAVSILSIILFMKVKFSKNNSILHIFLWGISLILTLIAGSRNALLALILSIIIMYIISEKYKGNKITGIVKFTLMASIILFLLISIVPQYGIDLSRYDYVTLISSGGSNRSTIWKELAPVIWERYKWFGYGPGHYCSTEIMKPIINKVYSHTHNTFFEAWGELGIIGIIPFVWIIVSALHNCIQYIREKSNYIFLTALFIVFLLISMGESLFANIELWLLIAFIANVRKKKTT